MPLATWIFWRGRKKSAPIPPAGKEFLRETFSREGLKSIANLLPIYAIIAVYWSLYDQSSSAWVEQAKHMDGLIFGFQIKPSQVQVINPVLVLIYVPLFTFVIH